MTMQNTPLLMSRILGRGAILDPEVEVVTQQVNKTHRQTLLQTWNRANQLANALHAHGIKVGDRIGSFMWNNYYHLELYQGVPSMGAVLHTLNIRLSSADLAYIINHAGDKVIFADEDLLPLLEPLWGKIPCVKLLVICRHGENGDSSFENQIDYGDFIKDQPAIYNWPEIDETSPMGLCYTSGTTGKPKGVLHTTGGYMVYASMTHQYIFDYKSNDIYWCTADIGWVTGHSYIIYGPLANGATTIMFEGIPNYPDSSRWWQIVDKYKVNIFYTAPTAIRALMREGDKPVKKTSRKSLKLLGTVGEPINPEAWMWYYKTVGDSRCPIVDTWWQTETGGILIAPQPGAIDLKPGSATKPFYGIKPVLVDKDGKVIKGEGTGRLCMAQSWPGQMRTVYGDHERFIDTYFSQVDGKYFTGDGCRRDKDGYYWITGRVDDVIIVSGHNLGTAEIESAFVAHPKVAEAAVVGFPHSIKGNGLYCYVTLNMDEKESGDLERDLKQWVKKIVGAHCYPDVVQFAPGLPKTRSGKIMRRILRKIAANDPDNLGDTTTLADPSVVESLIQNRQNKG